MLTVLKDLADSPVKRAAFQRDPEAFLERYETLSEYERYLLLERDAAAIEGYLRNPSVDPYVHAAPTVVNVTALIVVARVPHPEPAAAAQSHFSTFWSRVEDRARALS